MIGADIGKSQRSGSGAFTVLELLVVISIIAALLTILVPSLTRARAQANQTVCQARLGQWGLAFESYAAANSGFYPHIDGRDRTPQTPYMLLDKYDYYYGWVDLLPPYMSEKPWRDFSEYHYPGPKTIYQCPAAKPLPDHLYTYKPSKNGYFSYSMNSCLELDGNCWPPYDDPTANNMPSFLNTAKIKHPARLILLFDQLLDPRKAYNNTRNSTKAGKYCGSYPKYFSARHALKRGSLGGSVLLCDYHVEFRTTLWKKHWPDDLEVPPRTDYDWFPY